MSTSSPLLDGWRTDVELIRRARGRAVEACRQAKLAQTAHDAHSAAGMSHVWAGCAQRAAMRNNHRAADLRILGRSFLSPADERIPSDLADEATGHAMTATCHAQIFEDSPLLDLVNGMTAINTAECAEQIAVAHTRLSALHSQTAHRADPTL